MDPEWEWHTGEVPPPPPTGESGGSSSARDEPMTEQRQQRMHEEVYKAPCQNVFSSEFRRSKQWDHWCDARNTWIDTSLDQEDEAGDAQEPPAHARLGQMSESSEWGNAPWRQAKARRAKLTQLYPRDERDDKRCRRS